MNGLTQRQKRILSFVQDEIQAGRPVPTNREIAAHFGFSSPRAVTCHLKALRKKGHVAWDARKARSLRITSQLSSLRCRIMDIPIFGSVPAGAPSEGIQEPDGCVSVDINSVDLRPTQRTFALRVSGDSMIGKQICDGDIALVEYGPEPYEGQVVAALIDGKSTLKSLVRRNGRPFLKAENPKYADLIPCEELMVQGVLRAIIRKVR